MKKLICAILVIATLLAITVPAMAVSAASSDPLVYDMETELRWMGRTYYRQKMHFFNWSCAGFEFCFKGSGATAKIYSDAPGGKHTAYIKIYIDGVEQPDVALTTYRQDVVLAKDLDPNVEHTVKVVKRTNARSSMAALMSLTLHDGEKLPPPKDSPRYIEFIGDSLTVGYSTVPLPGQKEWTTAGEDATKTYNEPAAKAFFADYSVVAISGRGIVRNGGGDTDKLLSFIYDYVDQYNNPNVKYKFERQPDVIVINLGENDAASANNDLSSAEFKAGFKKFILNVRAKNPKAEILYTYGLTDTKFSREMKEVITQLRNDGDEHISYTQLRYCYDSERIVNHPTYEAYQKRAQTIIDLIAEATGWVPYDESDLNKPKEPEETTPVETTPAATTPAETTPVETDSTEPTDTTPATPDVTEPSDTEILVDSGCGSALLPMTLVCILPAASMALIKKKKEN